MTQTLSEEILLEIARKYGLQPERFEHVESGYRNLSHSFTATDRRKYNFILYKNEPGIVELIRRTNALGTYVAAKGLPVRAPLDARILRVGRRYGSLYDYLDGETIPWEAYTMKHIKLLGCAMAAFHKVARDYVGDLTDIEDVCSEIHDRMRDYFARCGVAAALKEKLNLVIDGTFLEQQNFLLIQGEKSVLHMDFVRGNMLFRNAMEGDRFSLGNVSLSGILDLEKAARGPAVYDVARTLAFLLVDCQKPAEKVRKYFLSSGYAKRGGGVLPNASQLEPLVTFFLTYDFYKFLKQNPYESLPKNHHFKRTVGILLTQKVLHYSH